MRIVVAALAVWSTAGAALAQDTIRTWHVGTSTICGLRQVGNRAERFIAEDTGRGLSYDFAPTETKWREEWCDRDPNAPAPTAESIVAQVSKPRPSCAQLEATWAGMARSERLEIARIRASQHYDDGCKLVP